MPDDPEPDELEPYRDEADPDDEPEEDVVAGTSVVVVVNGEVEDTEAGAAVPHPDSPAAATNPTRISPARPRVGPLC